MSETSPEAATETETAPEASTTTTPAPTEPPANEPEAEAPKPTETVEFWKQKAREQEQRAKSNAEKAKEFDAFQESQKTEAQKIADRATAAERERDEARAEGLRYRAAATHGVGEDYFDLLGAGTEEEITARAERVGGLLKSATDLTQAQAEIERLTAENEALRTGKPIPASGRPVAQLRPGAAPPPPPEVPDDGYPAEWLSPSQRASVERARGVTAT